MVRRKPRARRKEGTEGIPENTVEGRAIETNLSYQKALELAGDPDNTPFDYIVVGSGAGGGPLAARLALEGKRVLVIEAGGDPALDGVTTGDPCANPHTFDNIKWREIYAAPGYHAPATEDRQMSWDFSVRSYKDYETQKLNSKYCEEHDKSRSRGKDVPGTRGGIFYPRCSAIGGCTSHHAMIVIKPNASDWDGIAKLTGDNSWRPSNMDGYFARLENCLYFNDYQNFFVRLLGFLYWAWQQTLTFLNPSGSLDRGGHGSKGWQKTSFIDPLLVSKIARNDSTFFGVLRGAIWAQWSKTRSWGSMFKNALARLQIVRFLDPNFGNDPASRRDRLTFIPIGTDGKRRVGVREHLLDVAHKRPDRLTILTHAFVRRVVFKAGPIGPEAHGVEVSLGSNIYGACPSEIRKPGGEAQIACFFARQEIVLCGGSFNTPQLLMLSGIGGKAELEAHSIRGPRDQAGNVVNPSGVVDLPGVGKNLRDRYEVSVISELKQPLSTLSGISFNPGDANDNQREKWLRDGSGLYSTNGGALAILTSSGAKRVEPDLFVFGFPAAFRGYYWNYSKELLRPRKGAAQDQRNLWSWVLLKAYTEQEKGTVSLTSASPFDQPEIIFHSFEPANAAANDVEALAKGVAFVRAINDEAGGFANELQPGSHVPDGSKALNDWIKNEAWGHHACGTCRMGSDAWTAQVSTLADQMAVTDSAFRVHGVGKLRIVDASVFPTIPGYFLVTSVFMIAEKAADTLLAASAHYPDALEAAEAAAIQTRREKALKNSSTNDTGRLGKLPENTVGLALSGGGIRSATYSLGILQALAAKNRLREIDIMSTVSGGGYIGSFLGRLYTRVADSVADKAGRIQDTVKNINSPQLWWLRSHADYIGADGSSDLQSNLGVYIRNLASLHGTVGVFLFAVLGVLVWFQGSVPVPVLGIDVSPWWWLPLALSLVTVVPVGLGYWLAPQSESAAPKPLAAVLVALILLASAIVALMFPALRIGAFYAIGVILLAWLIEGMNHWRLPRNIPLGQRGTLVRNRLTRLFGAVLLLTAASVLWVAIDTLALHALLRTTAVFSIIFAMAGMAVAAPLMKGLPVQLATKAKAATSPISRNVRRLLAGLISIPAAAIILIALDMLAHKAFTTSEAIGIWATLSALVFSLVMGRALPFLNYSSLHSSYAERLVRTFLGASNDARVNRAAPGGPTEIRVAHPNDDLTWDKYRPHEKGGPLHLVNVCVNETADATTGRQLREDQGLPMCLGPSGVSLGLRYHTLWEPSSDREQPSRKVALRALRVESDPNAFHVLAHRDRETINVESLRLGRWMAISGAAFTTALGRYTSLPLSLLLGLLNVRIGYWWNSGVNAADRPGRFPPNLLTRFWSIPGYFFRTQSTILNEWRGYFPGPAERLWYLSDGGHFETTGIYELLRRKLPFIIAVNAGEDPLYRADDLALLMRKVRLDFGARFTWLEPMPNPYHASWDALDEAAKENGAPRIPDWVRGWMDPSQIGALSSIGVGKPLCAVLAHISYAGVPGNGSWLLFVKASVPPTATQDVLNYAAKRPSFPNESTFDQMFDDEQWESYRCLAEGVGNRLFREQREET